MVLQDLFDTLAAGEFAHLALGNSPTGTIKEEAYPKVVTALNRALRELYKRFILKKKSCLLYQQADLTLYYLRSEYIGSVGSMGESAYIADSYDDPFNDDIIRIIDIQTDQDEEVPLNSAKVTGDIAVRTAAFDTLTLITTKTDQVLTVNYQASYPRIIITDTFDPELVVLYYPQFIEEALTNYIASLLVKGRVTKASEGEGYATNTFLYRYEAACQKIVDLGLAEKFITEDSRFDQRGWV